MAPYLNKKLMPRFVKSSEWPPLSPDCNILDFLFWNKFQENVYEGCHLKPFYNVNELQEKILQVWNEGADDPKAIRKGIE